MASVLAAFFDPITPAEFLDRYWPDVPVGAHGPIERIDPWLKALELSTLASLLSCVSSVRVVQSQPVHREFFVTPREAQDHYNRGCTLCIIDIQQHVPAVRALLGELERALSIPPGTAMCEAFASPQGSGSPEHFDHHEVIVVQLSGCKTWQVAKNRSVPYPQDNYVAGEPLRPELATYARADTIRGASDASQAIVMQPGSVFFMPRGYWHSTKTDQGSLSLSIAVPLPVALDTVMEALRSKLLCETEMRRPLATDEERERARRLAGRLSLLVGDALRESSPTSS